MSGLCEVITIGKKQIDITAEKKQVVVALHTHHLGIKHVYNFSSKDGRYHYQTFSACRSCHEEDLLRSEIRDLPLFY